MTCYIYNRIAINNLESQGGEDMLAGCQTGCDNGIKSPLMSFCWALQWAMSERWSVREKNEIDCKGREAERGRVWQAGDDKLWVNSSRQISL